MKLALQIVILVFLTLSCSKKEQVVIENNTAPSYFGVSEVSVKNYINRCYIDLLGRTPYSNELDSQLTQLMIGELSDSSREAMLIDIIDNPEHKEWQFENLKAKYLASVTDIQISETESELLIILDYLEREDSNNYAYIDYVKNELVKVRELYNLPDSFAANSIHLNEYISKMIDNYIYDQINMGTENFVKACYENLFNRQATNSETIAGVRMVDGNSAVIKGIGGNSRGDFIDILCNSEEFYVGLSGDLYSTLLRRKMNTHEQLLAVQTLKSNLKLKDLQIEIMKSNEYAGF